MKNGTTFANRNFIHLFTLRSSQSIPNARNLSSSTITDTTRPFPDYSPKKPSVRDTELVHQIANVIKLRRAEPLRRSLKPYECKFKTDHLVWVLMKIRSDYSLVLDFFEWARSRRDSTLEGLCIVTHLAVACKDLRVAHSMIRNFWERPKLSVADSFVQFFELLVYTYKDWGSDPNVFNVFIQVLVEFGMVREARKVFEKMLNYGLVLSVDSCNLYLDRLSKECDKKTATAVVVFREFPKVGVCWNVASYKTL